MSVFGDYRFAILTSVPASRLLFSTPDGALTLCFSSDHRKQSQDFPDRVTGIPLPKKHGSARFHKCLRLLRFPKEIAYGHPDDINQRIEIGH
jgi:hypothetical protein